MKFNPSAETRRKVIEAIDAFEAACRRESAAFDEAMEAINRGEMEAIGDAHPASFAYLVARAGMWEASDQLSPLIADVGAMAIRRGDILYARVGATESDRAERAPSDDYGRTVYQVEQEPETIPQQIRRLDGQNTRILRYDMRPDSAYVLTMPE